jgi:hypothetical protein
MAKITLGDFPAWPAVRAAFREASGERYDLLWPPGLADFGIT